MKHRNYPAVQWLELCVFTSAGWELIPKSHMRPKANKQQQQQKNPTKNIKYSVTKSLLNKMQLKLEFIFSYIFVVHIIIKNSVNHWFVCFQVTPHSDL